MNIGVMHDATTDYVPSVATLTPCKVAIHSYGPFHGLSLVKVLLPPPTCRGALSEYAALAMPRLAHISGRAA